MFLKLFVAFLIVLLSIASEISEPLGKTKDNDSFDVKVFGYPSWDNRIISSVNATLVKKNVTKVLQGIKSVENNKLLLLTYLENNNQTKDYLAIIQYTKNGNEWNMKFFNIPEDCENLDGSEKNGVTKFNDTDYDCNLGGIELK
uniref:Salivary secreted protein n=1 Tax=Strongyloides papillosus TaxID=174720 RepID=A0A0N5BCX8_STREA